MKKQNSIQHIDGLDNKRHASVGVPVGERSLSEVKNFEKGVLAYRQ